MFLTRVEWGLLCKGWPVMRQFVSMSLRREEIGGGGKEIQVVSTTYLKVVDLNIYLFLAYLHRELFFAFVFLKRAEETGLI